MRLFQWLSNTVKMDKTGQKMDFGLIEGIIIQTIIQRQKFNSNIWTKRWVLPQCAISWCVDVKIVRKRVIKTVHFDNGRKRAKNRKLVTSVRDLLLRKKKGESSTLSVKWKIVRKQRRELLFPGGHESHQHKDNVSRDL